MKIGNSDKLNPLAGDRAAEVASGKAGKPGVVSASSTTAEVEASAKVALSSTAAELSAGGSSAEFDAEKVERISRAIAEGKFQVNHEVIADKLIANAQDLLSKVSH